MQLTRSEDTKNEPVEDVSEAAPEITSPGDPTNGHRASRWWLAGAFALALAVFVPDAFGRQVFDTKIDLTVNPIAFFDHIFSLWDPNGWFGFLRNQVQGYAFPTDPLFIVGHVLGIQPWVVQRIWMAIVVTVAFWGIVRLAEELRIGSLASRLAAGGSFALLPTLTILVGTVTAEAIPGALTAWATIPLVRASRSGSPIRGAALSAVAILFMGGANAADTLYALVIPLLFLLTREPTPRKRSLLRWWVVCVVLATAWWLIPLLFLGKYGFNFLPYIEQSVTTTSTSSATSALSGSSVWTAYLNLNGLGWNQAGLTVTSVAVAILGPALMAATGLHGIATREIRERRFLVVSLAAVTTVALAAYWGPFGGPWSHSILPILNGTLAPFRSIYKIEPAIGLLLALGIAHSLDKFSAWKPRRCTRMAWRVVAASLTIAVLASMATPYLIGRAVANDSYTAIPSYWYKVADYLARVSPRNTALVLPAASHGEYVWGWTVDQPLEALARSPWADDQAVPFGGPGSSRMIDSIELALRTNTRIPALSALLWRAGIKDVVVQNDLQWQLSDSPSPQQVHEVLEGSGLKRVAQYGPTIETSVIDIPTLSLINSRTKAAFPAVEIYQARPPSGTKGPISPVDTLAASSAALVSGGPEAIQQLLDHGVIGVNQAAVLAGDWHGQYHGSLFAVTDTLRRVDVNFGLVNDNTSYTFTAAGKTSELSGLPNRSAPPGQLLPVVGLQHQTVAVLKGAASITSSSAGSEFYYLPEYDPANVFDGQSSTGWISGNPFGSVGEWIQINFEHPIDPKGTRLQLLVGRGHPRVTDVRLSTNRGSVLTHVKPTGSAQFVNVPAGTARFLRVTFVSLAGPSSQSRGAGIRTISIPGVHVQKILKPPQEAIGSLGQRLAFSFQTTPYDAFDVLRSDPEPVMARQFNTPQKMTLTVTGTATPRPGAALDALLGPSGGVNVSASSTFGNNPGFRPQNLVDNDLQTSWVGGSADASVHMQWKHAMTLSSLNIIDARDSFAAAPKQVLISSKAGRRLINVGQSTTLNFAPITTNNVTVSFPKVRKHEIANVFGGKVQAPIGLAELSFPALASLEGKPPNFSADLSLPCGFGPPVVIDGRKYETSLGQVGRSPSPTYADLVGLKAVGLTICSAYGSLPVNRGSHVLVAPRTDAPFDVSSLTLSQVVTPTANKAAPLTALQPQVRKARVLSWASESREIALASGPSTYLEVHQNYNAGWTATLNGKTLMPIRLDGWQQGYLVPAGRGGTVHLSFAPEKPYSFGLVLGVLGVLLLLLIALGVVGSRRGVTLEPSPPWSARLPYLLALALVAVVVFVISGPLVLVVPVLALIGIRRPTLLPWVAFAGMTAAGAVAAFHPGTGALSRLGAFSAPAQVCAIVALSAVLVPVAYRRLKSGAEPPSPSASGALLDGFAGMAGEIRAPKANGDGVAAE